MTRRESYMSDKILKNIDAFVNGQENSGDGLQSYTNLVNVRPFTSGKFKAKVANKLVYVPLKTFKKAMIGYLHQRDIELFETQQKLTSIEEKIDYLQESLDAIGQQINRK